MLPVLVLNRITFIFPMILKQIWDKMELLCVANSQISTCYPDFIFMHIVWGKVLSQTLTPFINPTTTIGMTKNIIKRKGEMKVLSSQWPLTHIHCPRPSLQLPAGNKRKTPDRKQPGHVTLTRCRPLPAFFCPRFNLPADSPIRFYRHYFLLWQKVTDHPENLPTPCSLNTHLYNYELIQISKGTS